MILKNRFICKLASISRRKKLFKLNWLITKLYDPEKRKNDCIDRIILLEDNNLIHIDTRSYLEWYIFFYGSYEPMVSNLIKATLSTGGIALDVGANIGIHSLSMARAVGATGRVYSFEPHRDILKKLIENLSLNNMFWVEPVNIGLAKESGTAILHSFDGSDSNQGTSSILNQFGFQGQKFEIKILSLDDFSREKNLARLDFLKIDVEGSEMDVLLGGIETLKRFRPSIVFEYNLYRDMDKQGYKMIISFFEALGYKLYLVESNYLIDLNKADILGNVNIFAVYNKL